MLLLPLKAKKTELLFDLCFFPARKFEQQQGQTDTVQLAMEWIKQTHTCISRPKWKQALT